MPLRFRLATREDDAALRHAYASTPMEGGMRLAFEREPSFLDALRVQGAFVQVMVGEDSASGEIAAFGTRSIAEAFVNGSPTPLGYLGDLRILPSYRNGTVLARGWKFFHQLHEDGRTALYHTAIFSGNKPAKAALSGGRATVPAYHPAGTFCTAGIRPSGKEDTRSPKGWHISRGTPELLSRVVEFLNAWNATRQFAPFHRETDFGSGGRWHGLRVEDFFLLWEGPRLRAVAALWDQSAFKQTRVLGYSGKWSLLFLLSRLSPRFLGIPRLPHPGSHLRSGYVSFIGMDGDDPALLACLLHAMRVEASRRGWLSLLLSLHERDPLQSALHGLPYTRYGGDLYAVAPGEAVPTFARNGLPHIEAALL